MSLLVALLMMWEASHASDRCQSVHIGQISIEPQMEKTYTKIKVSDPHGTNNELVLEDEGLGHVCFELKAFERRGVLMVRHRTGVMGTSVLVQREVLSFYRVVDRLTGKLSELEEIASFDLSQTEESGQGRVELFRKTFRIAETPTELRVQVGRKIYSIK
jgi:hypothetical protein